MKLLEMRCIKDKNVGDVALNPENHETCYMVKLETETEANHYNDANWDDYEKNTFASKLRDSLGVTDDDVLYYLGMHEQEPEVGETFELDGMAWERVA